MLKFKPDVVHTHHLNQLFYATIAAKLTGARIIHTEHEYFSLQNRRSIGMLRFLAHFCYKVTGVGNNVTEFLATAVGIPRSKLQTIPNGIDVAAFIASSPLRREDFGFSAETRIMGIVARLEQVKDHETLLQALKIIERSHHDLSLLIIGDGSLRLQLEDRCRALELKDKVRFLGLRTDISALLELIDIFVLCSREEGLPMSILEAMAAGKPIVATGVGSIPEVIIDGVNGVLVEPGDYEQLAASCLQLLNNPQQAEKLGSSARERLRELHDFSHSLSLYEKLFCERKD